MISMLEKQNKYNSPVDIILKINLPEGIVDYNSLEETLYEYINAEVCLFEGVHYKINSIMKDVCSNEYYAFCQELIQPKDL